MPVKLIVSVQRSTDLLSRGPSLLMYQAGSLAVSRLTKSKLTASGMRRCLQAANLNNDTALQHVHHAYVVPVVSHYTQ